jgi:hypothetical protein
MPSLLDSYSKMTLRPKYVEVQNWNLDKETLDFNYCFPVDKNPKLIDNAVKMIPARLQATYFETSGPQTGLGLHCWTMRKDDIKLTNKPLSIFWQIPLTVVMSLLGKLK